MLHPDESYELTGSVVILTTAKAALVRLASQSELWIPRSVCVDGDDLTEEDTDISVHAWWAEKEGLDP